MIVYLDALVVKMRHEGWVENRAVFVAIGITHEGSKEVLGLWTSATEEAKLWLQILTEIRDRGVADILIACVDGLKGFPEAISTVYPRTEVQLCIVHMVRNSVAYVNWKEKAVAEDRRGIYHAPSEEAGMAALESFEQRWNSKYAVIGKLWRRQWTGISPQFAYPEEIRRAIYTTNVGRVAAYDAAQSDQDAGVVPERRVRAEAAVSSVAQYRAALARRPELAHLVESFLVALGRPHRSRCGEGRPLIKPSAPPALRPLSAN